MINKTRKSVPANNHAETEHSRTLMKVSEYMDKMLFLLASTDSPSMSGLPQHGKISVPKLEVEHVILNGRKNVTAALNYMLEYNSSRGIMEFKARSSLDSFLYNTILRHSKNVPLHVFHSLHLSRQTEPDGTEGLELLFLLLPVLISKIRLTLTHYTAKDDHPIWSNSLMPYFFIMGNMVVFCSADYESGYFIRNEDYARHVSNLFYSVQSVEQPLIREQSIIELNAHLSRSSEDIYFISGLAANPDKVARGTRHHYLLPTASIQTFLLTGQGIGQGSDMELPENRSKMLQKLMKNIKDGSTELFLSRESGPLPNRASILFSGENVYVVSAHSSQPRIWCFAHPESVRLLTHYFDRRVHSERTMSQEESIQWLEDAIASQIENDSSQNK